MTLTPQRRLRTDALIVVSVLLSASASACAAQSEPETEGLPITVGHVHGVGADPADGSIYLAAHGGVFEISDGRARLVADRAQDTMGFTVAGPNRFLASGHPDVRDRDAPPHLGLIESRDQAQTWKTLSLAGEADFHSLDVGRAIYGYDSTSGQLMRSTDGTAWQTLWAGQVIDIAADPERNAVLVSTPAGSVLRISGGAAPEPLTAAPKLGLLDWPEPNLLVGLDPSGRAWASSDSGSTWTAGGEPLGSAVALDVSSKQWLAATDSSLNTSVDEGRTWTRIATY